MLREVNCVEKILTAVADPERGRGNMSKWEGHSNALQFFYVIKQPTYFDRWARYKENVDLDYLCRKNQHIKCKFLLMREPRSAKY